MQHPMRALRRTPEPRLTKAEKLAQAAQAAAEVRAYDTNPDVIAYKVEKMRARVDHLMWSGVILGLAFTAANVQGFAAGTAPMWSIPWCIAWLLDPTVSLVLLGTLLGEQVIARYQIEAGRWIRATKWVALLLTYLMNTWASWTVSPAAVLLHSVPPIIVFCAAEAITTLKHQITEAVHRAYEQAAVRATATAPTLARTAPVRRALVFRTAPRTEAPRTVRHLRAFAFQKTADVAPVHVLRRAFTFQQAARTEPVPPPHELPETPADKDVFVRELREEILAAAARNDRWGPDYDALIARARRSRSWVEKRVREARTSVFPRTEVAA